MHGIQDVTLEQKYQALCNIMRAQHHAWREAVKQRCPHTPVTDVLKTMWEIAGEEAGEAFYRGIDKSQPIPPQVAEAIKTSWEVMGQHPGVECTESGEEAHVTQVGCPWFAWHVKHDLVEEDRVGCDAWFDGVLSRLNARLGTNIAVETCETLPEIWADSLSVKR